MNWIVSPSKSGHHQYRQPVVGVAGEVPVSLLDSNGTYQLYFNGNGTGFGYATSSDGIHWTIGSTAIRSGGYTLDAVVNVNQDGSSPNYIAYYTQGGVLYTASSSDGVTFSGDTPVNAPAGYAILATALTTIDGQGALVAAFEDSSGHGFYGVTTDGTNFTIEGAVTLPAGMTVNSLLIENGVIKFYGGDFRERWRQHGHRTRDRAGARRAGISVSERCHDFRQRHHRRCLRDRRHWIEHDRRRRQYHQRADHCQELSKP